MLRSLNTADVVPSYSPGCSEQFGGMQWTSSLAANVWNGIGECIKLSDVVTVRPGQDDRQRDAFRVDNEGMFAAVLAPARWIRAGFLYRSSDSLHTSSWTNRR